MDEDDGYEYAREIVDAYATDSGPSLNTLKDEWAKEGWVFVDELHRPTSEAGKWEVVLTFRRRKAAASSGV